MKTETDKQGIGRRAFLRGVGASAGAAGAVAAVGAATGPAEAKAADPRDKADAGYRETEHVRRVYDLARF